jgi:hypothetical protein
MHQEECVHYRTLTLSVTKHFSSNISLDNKKLAMLAEKPYTKLASENGISRFYIFLKRVQAEIQ